MSATEIIPVVDLGPYLGGEPGAMERTAAEMNTQLLVVYLPTNYWGPPNGLAKVIGNIRLLDLTEAFHRNREAGGPNPYIVGDGHPSAAGNALIASEISKYVRREGLLK